MKPGGSIHRSVQGANTDDKAKDSVKKSIQGTAQTGAKEQCKQECAGGLAQMMSLGTV